MNGIVLPPTYTWHPDFAEFRRKSRTLQKLVRLCVVMQQSGDGMKRRRRISLWAENLANGSEKRLWQDLALLQDANIITSSSEDGWLTIAWQEWVWDSSVVIELPIHETRPAFPSDDTHNEKRRQEREAARKQREAGQKQAGAASAAPALASEQAEIAAFRASIELAESQNTPPTTPPSGNSLVPSVENAVLADSADIPVPVTGTVSLYKEPVTGYRNPVPVNMAERLAELGMDRKKAQERVAEYGEERCQDALDALEIKQASAQPAKKPGGWVVDFLVNNRPLPKALVARREGEEIARQQGAMTMLGAVPGGMAESKNTPPTTTPRSAGKEGGIATEAILALRDSLSAEEVYALRQEAEALWASKAPQTYAHFREARLQSSDLPTRLTDTLKLYENDVLALRLKALRQARSA